MLEPLFNIISNSEDIESMDEEMIHEIKIHTQKVFDCLSESFQYEKYGFACAKEFTDVVKNHHNIIVTNADNLVHYKVILQYDVRLQ